MKLLFEIEYRTRWGEQLVLLFGRRRIALQYADNGLWRGSVERYADRTPVVYRYAVERDGARIRSEWRPHALVLPEIPALRVLRIRDRWQEMPDDAPFHSSAFTRGIFARRAEPHPRKRRTETDAPDSANVTFRVVMPSLRPEEVLAVAAASLGNWQKIVPMDDSRFPEWDLSLHLPEGAEYKFLVADRATLAPVRWEEGANRVWTEPPIGHEHRIEAAAVPHLPRRQWRGAGTAVPVFSLRSRESFGVGEFADLKLLVDWAVQTRQRVLQILPVNDTSMTGSWEDSYPYNAVSTFALHPQHLRLTAAGVEADGEYLRLRDELNALPEVDYERVNRAKLELLRQAFERDAGRTARRREYRRFLADNAHWLMPYAVFCSLRDTFHTADFSRWGEYARYDKACVEAYARSHRREIAFHCFVQYHLHLQLAEACRYARERGVVLKGDLPIGISRTSVDAWLHPQLFHLDAQAGAPPDAFSAEGQNWGFPTYDWERMARDDYAWWRARLAKMAEYFDAFRIDHILGFFRIWEIPLHAVHGLLGHFSPALPYSAEELRERGFDTSGGRYVTPAADDGMLDSLFGDLAGEVRGQCFEQGRLRPEFATQRRVVERFAGKDEHQSRLREGLLRLLDDVLFVEDPRRRGFFHPRIAAHSTRLYASLDEKLRNAFDRLYDDFFYRRHNRFWKESALHKLPALLGATGMLACGEDLGMIPDCVPETMRELQILSLEIQRMSKIPGERFADPARYPYYSVCSTSTHDMTPLRAWWEEEPETTGHFFREALGCSGEVPESCEPWIARRIVHMHLNAPSMLAILPLQDWLATDNGPLRRQDPLAERINVPAVARYYWRYRMHLTLEELLGQEAFNTSLREMIACSGRQ